MSYAVEINNLSVQYNNIPALSNISLSVAENDFLAIIGPNGGGKSTLIKTVLGIIKPQCGTIKIFGQSHENIAFRLAMFLSFQTLVVIFPLK